MLNYHIRARNFLLHRHFNKGNYNDDLKDSNNKIDSYNHTVIIIIIMIKMTRKMSDEINNIENDTDYVTIFIIALVVAVVVILVSFIIIVFFVIIIFIIPFVPIVFNSMIAVLRMTNTET